MKLLKKVSLLLVILTVLIVMQGCAKKTDEVGSVVTPPKVETPQEEDTPEEVETPQENETTDMDEASETEETPQAVVTPKLRVTPKADIIITDYTIIVDAKIVDIPVQPVMKEGNLFIPLSSILKAMNASEEITGDDITVNYRNMDFDMVVGKNQVKVGDTTITLKGNVQKESDIIMVTDDFFTEVMGADMGFNEDRKTYAFSTGLVYQEKDGIVVGEVEMAAFSEDWVPLTIYDDYEGACYYQWNGAENFSQPSNLSKKGLIALKFRIHTPGVYHFSLRNRHDYHNSTEENDIWSRVNNGSYVKTFSHVIKEFTTDTGFEVGDHELIKDPTFIFEPGIHTLYLMPRSEKFAIDRFIFYIKKDGFDIKTATLVESEAIYEELN